jgi:hypothetical protein
MLGAAAVSAGAVAGLALPAGAAMASSDAPRQAAPDGPLSIEIGLHPNINLKQITALVARVGGLVGCRACGLVGIDMRLFVVDPAELKEIAVLEGTPGVASALVSQQ